MSTPAPRLLLLAEFLRRPRPSWLVDGLLSAGEMAVLSGAPGSGKTFVALELAGCVTQGRDFAGRFVRRGRVLYLVAEGCAGMRDRFDVLEQENRVDRENLIVSDSACQIGNQGERQALQAKLEEMNFKPDLIIVDTLARHAVGVEENSAKDMGVWIASVEALMSEFQCTVLLVHHIGKADRSGMRGSTALPGAISTAISCEKDGNVIKLKCAKQKDADEFAPLSFGARKVRHGDIESLVLDHIDGGSPQADRLKPDESAILNALTTASTNSVRRGDCKRFDGSLIPESSFERAINRLIALGHAERISQGEYLLRKSPSPNDPHKSPMGKSCTSDKFPPSPPPYKGGDVGIGGGNPEGERNDVAHCLPVTLNGDGIQRIAVPNFAELNTWPPSDQREREWLN